jgi:hypothetical protein
LLALYPDQQSALDATLATMLAGIADGEAKGKGIDLGKKAAADLIALRANYGIDAQETYRPHTTPRHIHSDGCSSVFHIRSRHPVGDEERLSISPCCPPSALTSETWTNDVNEIRELGRIDSAKRTPEQTTIGRFWFVTGPRSYDPIVRQVAMKKDMDIADCARLFDRDGRKRRLHSCVRC